MRRLVILPLLIFSGINLLNAQMSTPVNNWTTPVKNWTTPVKQWTKPVKNWTTPVAQPTKPVELSTPVKDWTTPVELSTPVKDWSTPVELSKPVELSTPVKNWTTPVELSTSVKEWSTPVTQWTTPVELSKPVELSTPIKDWTTPGELTTPVKEWSKSVGLSTQVELSKPVELARPVELNRPVELSSSSQKTESSIINNLGEYVHYLNNKVGAGLSIFTANFDDANKMWEQKYAQSVVEGRSKLLQYFYLHQAVATSLFTTENAPKTISALAFAIDLPYTVGVRSVKVINAATKEGFSTFNEFKAVYGSAGKDYAWHHIVEQGGDNIAKFGADNIHNVNNLIKLPNGAGSIHAKVSGYYSSKQAFTEGQTVRQWLSTQNYQQQYDFGINILNQFGWKP